MNDLLKNERKKGKTKKKSNTLFNTLLGNPITLSTPDFPAKPLPPSLIPLSEKYEKKESIIV